MNETIKKSGKSPLTVFPDKTIVLPQRYYGKISYYAAMAAYGKAKVCGEAVYDKRHKAAHRCDIADTHGFVQLTVPVAKPHGITRARWSDVRISDHGQWWHVHRVTLESAYGRTPFFEFYIDRFLPFLSAGVVENYPSVTALNIAIDTEIRNILLIPAETDYSAESYEQCMASDTGSENVDGVKTANAIAETKFPAYYQVRAAKQGFMPDLSVLDLIFNLGPEAPLYLNRLITKSRLT